MMPASSAPRSSFLIFILLMVLLLSTCLTNGQNSTNITTPFVPPATIKFAWLGSLSLQSSLSLSTGQAAATATADEPARHCGNAYLPCLTDCGSCVLSPAGQNGLFTFRMAIDEANARPDLWLPNTTIVPMWADSFNDSATTITSTYDMINAGAIAFVGEYQSLLAQLGQYVCQHYKVPQISPGAADTSFASKHSTLYPYFLRNVPQVTFQAAQLCQLIKSFGWQKIAIIFTSDTYGAGGQLETTKACLKLGVSVLVSASMNQGDTDVSFLVQRVVLSKARIIVYWGQVADLQTVWRTAVNPDISDTNILGDGYQWVLNQAASVNTLYTNTDGSIAKDMLALGSGAIGLTYTVNTSLPEYKSFAARYRARPYSSVTSTIHPAPNATIAPRAPFSYDATWHMIRAARHLIVDLQLDPNLPENRATFMQAALNVTFTGASGPVKLDQNGDRLAAFTILNLKRTTKAWTSVGSLDSSGKLVLTNASIPLEFQGLDGTVMPLDAPLKTLKSIGSSIKIGLIVVCVALITMIAGVQVAVLTYQNHPILKASSPLFLILYLVGIQLLCASVIPRSLESEVSLSPGPCFTDLWLTNIGYTLLIGALFVKTFRLQLIFNRTKLHMTTKLNDGNLLLALGVALIVEAGLLIGLSVGAPMSQQLMSLNDLENYYICHTNNYNENELNTIYLPATVSTRFALLLATTVFVFRVRNIPDTFNESKELGTTIYNLLFLSVLLPAIDGALGRAQDTPVIAYSVCVFVICILSVVIMIAPKFVGIYQLSLSKKQGGNGMNKAGNNTSMDNSTKVPTNSSQPSGMHLNQRESMGLSGGQGVHRNSIELQSNVKSGVVAAYPKTNIPSSRPKSQPPSNTSVTPPAVTASPSTIPRQLADSSPSIEPGSIQVTLAAVDQPGSPQAADPSSPTPAIPQSPSANDSSAAAPALVMQPSPRSPNSVSRVRLHLGNGVVTQLQADHVERLTPNISRQNSHH